MKKLAIYDMDGTIVCSSHRYRSKNNRIDLQYWRDNCTAEKIAQDSVLPHHRQYVKDLQCKNTKVIIATARSMIKGDANFDFIKYRLGQPDHIVHRLGDDDHRKGVDLKNTGIIKNLTSLDSFGTITIYEDNLEYLQGMTEFFESKNKVVYPIFVKSQQGH